MRSLTTYFSRLIGSVRFRLPAKLLAAVIQISVLLLPVSALGVADPWTEGPIVVYLADQFDLHMPALLQHPTLGPGADDFSLMTFLHDDPAKEELYREAVTRQIDEQIKLRGMKRGWGTIFACRSLTCETGTAQYYLDRYSEQLTGVVGLTHSVRVLPYRTTSGEKTYVLFTIDKYNNNTFAVLASLTISAAFRHRSASGNSSGELRSGALLKYR